MAAPSPARATIETKAETKIETMNLKALAACCARVAPTKMQVALPLLIIAKLYWLSSLPGTSLPGDPALYALFYWTSPTLQNALHVPAYAALAGAWCWALRAWLHSSTAGAMVAGGRELRHAT